ncbi:MAG: beta-propeller domain-containing protein [Caulobacteraceae bacterium]|nr:beta-propeller domain-containing protein [Caulobacteraceae bacterium]
MFSIRSLVAVAVAAIGLSGAARAAEPEPHLSAFGSMAEFRAHIDHAGQDPSGPACPADWPECAEDGYLTDEIIVTGSRVTAPSITNNQEAGVDEGGIVKMRGDTLVILRRGRLFTVDTSGDGLRPVDSINAWAPGPTPEEAEDAWYDEMLVVDDWVVVIGYAYGRDATEINRFRLDRRGSIRFVDSHLLSSNDYYSSRNYASRLVGRDLVLYTPGEIDTADEALTGAPQLIRWRNGRRGEAQTILVPESVYRAPTSPEGRPELEALHVVTRCDLTRPRLTCDATAILGSWSRTFYVAPDATYVWMTGSDRYNGPQRLSHALVYRVPLDGSAPTAARVLGAPTDQFSFAEDRTAGVLRVLVRSEGDGDAMWRPEFSEGSAALLTLPLTRFGDGAHGPDPADYRMLGTLPDNAWRMVNRFTPHHALFTVSAPGTAAGGDGLTLLTAVPLSGGATTELLLSGRVERIEPVGNDALIISRGANSLLFETLNLAADVRQTRFSGPRITHTYELEGANGAETRSHAFFYQPDADSPGGERGIMGLPVIPEREEGTGLFEQAADMAFLRRRGDRVVPVGELVSDPEGQEDDGCQVSCVDWYGDARPIFVAGRVFALLGYELVEGVEVKGRLGERRRVSFAPRSANAPQD